MMMKLSILVPLLSAVTAYPNGAPYARLPALGWSSWVALGPGSAAPVFDYCDDFSVRASADAMISLGLYAAGYRHLHLDDCWAGPRNATGFLTPEADHFPNGMKAVIDYVHSLDLVFGLYTCSGTETCVGGRPGSFGHWTQDAQVFAEWGVDWVKQDYCFVPAEYAKNPIPIYTNMSNALNATGRHISFSMCEWGLDAPWVWGDSVAQSWRMAEDHTGNWFSTKKIIAASAAIPAENTGRPYGWNDMDMTETGCGMGGVNCAHANNKQQNMSDIEYKTEFSMWAISASPLQFTAPIMNCTSAPIPDGSISLIQQLSKTTCDNTASPTFGLSPDNSSMWINGGCRGIFSCNGNNVTCNINGTGIHYCPCNSGPVQCTPWISDLQKEILLNAEVLEVNQDITPQGRPLHDGDLSVWSRSLSDGSVAIAFYNQDDVTASMHVTFTDLGWAQGTSATVRDTWLHTDLGTFTNTFPTTGNSVNVPPHGTMLVRITKV